VEPDLVTTAPEPRSQEPAEAQILGRPSVPEPGVGEIPDRATCGLVPFLPLFLVPGTQNLLVEATNSQKGLSPDAHVRPPDPEDWRLLSPEIEFSLPKRLPPAQARDFALKPESDWAAETARIRVPLGANDHCAKPMGWSVDIIIDKADRIAHRGPETSVAGGVEASVWLPD
jgi:hypothetical protein